VIFIFIKLPDIQQEKAESKSSTIKDALAHKHLNWAIVAQFFYVGAQVCVLSFFVRFVTASTGVNDIEASWYSGAAGLAFMIGRFAGTFFMQFLQPNRLLMLYAAICVLLSCIAIYAQGTLIVYALIGIAFFMSVMFPTIFSMGIAELGKDTKIGSSLIVMSIVGGAILPLAFGYISDITGNIRYGYIVPGTCFFMVFIYAWKKWKPVLNEGALNINTR